MRGARAVAGAPARRIARGRERRSGRPPRSSSARTSTDGSSSGWRRGAPTRQIRRRAPVRRRRPVGRGSRSRAAERRGARRAAARSGSTCGRLDTLMKQVGELVVAKNRLGVLALAGADPALGEVSDRISRLVSAMQGEVIAARMTPVGEVFDRFPRLVRDLGARSRQADPVRHRRRGDRARPLDPRRDRRAAAAPDPERGRSRHRDARGAARGGEAGGRPHPALGHAASGTASRFG